MLGSFSRDPGGDVASILGFALVRDELFLDVGMGILSLAYSLGICRELGVTVFTHAKHRRNIILPFDDPEFTLRHTPQFPTGWIRLLGLWKFKLHYCKAVAAAV